MTTPYFIIPPLTANPTQNLVTNSIWLDDGTNTADGNPAFRYYDGTNTFTLPTLSTIRKATSIADATVANTVTETTIIGTLKTGDSLAFAADYLAIGTTVRVTFGGIVSNTGTPTLNIIVKVGSTTLCSTGAITTASGLSSTGFQATADVTIRTTGATATLKANGMLTIGGNSYPLTDAGNTIDTTGALTLDITATWGTASASNTITGQTAVVEVLP